VSNRFRNNINIISNSMHWIRTQ